MAKRKKNAIGSAISGVGSVASGVSKHGGGSSNGGAVGAASSGVASVSGGVGRATGTSTGYSSAGAGVASVASGVGRATGTSPAGYTPTHPTTTVNLKPLVSTISDPAMRALAPSAIRSGMRYEINPSVLLASASVSDYGRKGSGRGYTNLGDGSEDGAKSIRQAAQYLSEVGFHGNPQGAIKALAKRTGTDPTALKKIAAGYTALDEAARKIETTPGDVRARGVGHFRNRNPQDRPAAKARPVARDVGHAMEMAGFQAAGQRPVQGTERADINAENTRDRLAAQGQSIGPQGQQQPTGPRPRKVANRLERAIDKAAGEVPGYVPKQYRGLIADASSKTGVPAGLLSALLQQESGFQAHIGSPAGAQGIAQFMPGTAASRGVNPNDPRSAIPGAAQLLAENKKQFGSWELALAAYNAGPGAPGLSQGQIPPYSETQNYVKTIMANAGNTADVAKSVPKQLVQRANKVLGKPATKALLAGGKLVRDPDAKGTGPVKVTSARDQLRAGAIVKATPQEDKYFSYDHNTDRAWFDPVLMKQLVKLAKASGEPIQLNSGFRTLKEQKAAYADYQNGGALAATPGSSNHEFGLAADISLTDTQRGLLSKFGLGLPVSGEDWHVEVVDPGLQAKQRAVNLGSAGGSATVTGGSTNIAIPGTNLAVRPPPTTATGGALSATGTAAASGAPATNLGNALNEAEKQQRAAGAPGLTLSSAAAGYARSALTRDATDDPIYDAFRPRR